jgi:hypothetical protein
VGFMPVSEGDTVHTHTAVGTEGDGCGPVIWAPGAIGTRDQAWCSPLPAIARWTRRSAGLAAGGPGLTGGHRAAARGHGALPWHGQRRHGGIPPCGHPGPLLSRADAAPGPTWSGRRYLSPAASSGGPMATKGRLSATLPYHAAGETRTGERTIGDALEDAARHWGGATALVGHADDGTRRRGTQPQTAADSPVPAFCPGCIPRTPWVRCTC